MARRNKKSDSAIGWLALIIGAVVILAKILLALLPFIIIGGGIYFYFKWQNRKLAEYDNDWNSFYQYELKSKLKIAAIALPVSLGVGYFGYTEFQKQEKEKIEREATETERQRIEEEQKKFILQAKKNSSNHFLELAQKDLKRKKYKSALVNLDSALIIFPENHTALFEKGIALKGRRKYDDAISIFDSLNIKTDKFLSEAYLEKGRCLLKLKKKREAIVQVYHSAELNNEEAQKIYDKINPIIKEIVGYRQKCCDGSFSYSKGRGTCSGHGGVCKWNVPIYNERRKYTIK